MKEYLISTKADTLADLREIVKHSYIEELSIVGVFYESVWCTCHNQRAVYGRKNRSSQLFAE